MKSAMFLFLVPVLALGFESPKERSARQWQERLDKREADFASGKLSSKKEAGWREYQEIKCKFEDMNKKADGIERRINAMVVAFSTDAAARKTGEHLESVKVSRAEPLSKKEVSALMNGGDPRKLARVAYPAKLRLTHMYKSIADAEKVLAHAKMAKSYSEFKLMLRKDGLLK